jgi:hypothetical protein
MFLFVVCNFLCVYICTCALMSDLIRCGVTGCLNDVESYPLAAACNVYVTTNYKSDFDLKEGCWRFLFVTDSHVRQVSSPVICVKYFSCWVQWKWQTSPAQHKYSYDYEISGVPYVIGEVFALVGCYASYVCSLPTFWGSLSVPSSTVPKLR